MMFFISANNSIDSKLKIVSLASPNKYPEILKKFKFKTAD